MKRTTALVTGALLAGRAARRLRAKKDTMTPTASRRSH